MIMGTDDQQSRTAPSVTNHQLSRGLHRVERREATRERPDVTRAEHRQTAPRRLFFDKTGQIAANKSQFCWQLTTLIILIAYIVSLFALHRPESGVASFWQEWTRNLAMVSPAIPIFQRVRKQTALRGPWCVMGVGVLIFSLSNLIHLLPVRNLDLFPNLSPKDVLCLMAYMTFAFAVALMTQKSFGPHAISVRLDGAITGLAFAALASMFWFDQILKISGQPLQAEIDLSYPIIVLVLLVLLVSALVSNRFRVDKSTTFLIIGLLSFIVGDAIQLKGLVTPSYAPSAILEASWPVGLWCFAMAAWPARNRRNEFRRNSAPVRGLNLVPVVFGVVSTAVLTLSLIHHTSKATSFMALGSLSLVIMRMAITQGEVRQLGKANFSEARTDNVTGLSNRRAFFEEGELKLASLKDSQQFGIVLIDLDGFKEVNDTIGHSHGDELLRIIGQRFANEVANHGAVARIGGDEFAYTFVMDSGGDPLTSANGLAQTLHTPVSLDGTKIRVRASIGVAVSPNHGTTLGELLRSADVAMYDAKRRHREVCLYQDEIDLHSRERLSLIDELRTAIEKRHLVLHFQPTIDLRTERVHGVEALVRWQHPTRGLLYPDDFIPLAERVGLIVPLTRAVLELAICKAAELERNGHRLRMSVNISQLDLMDEKLPQSIDRMLKWYSLSPTLLTLEVTESSLGTDLTLVKSSLEELRSRGIRISIDDYGVGYSSMSQLLDLPVDELKIDKSFVFALESDKRAISLIRSTIEMARALDLTVVAEGVENRENLESLRRIGTNIAQGNFIARPLTNVQLEDFLSIEHVESTLDLNLSQTLGETLGG